MNSGIIIAVFALLTALSSGLGWGLYTQIQANGALKKEARMASIALEAQKQIAARAQRDATASYENASDACQASIRSAVAAVKLKPIEVPRYDESGNPSPTCPAVSLRDIQAAGSGAFVPSSSGSESKTGTDIPR